MDRNDQQAIEQLFAKLAEVEGRSPPRDAEAERYIRDQIARQPGAPYYMAQTIIVQERALDAAQQRIEALERTASAAGARNETWEGAEAERGEWSDVAQGRRRPTGSVPSVGRPDMDAPRERYAAQREGGGFLAGAAQTAMGVAGGILLGNMIAGLFGSDKAQAAEPKSDAGQDQPQSDQHDAQADQDDAQPQDAGFDDTGFDDGGFGDIDI
jgi:hypothetical protein